jgi:hypothetical protein
MDWEEIIQLKWKVRRREWKLEDGLGDNICSLRKFEE